MLLELLCDCILQATENLGMAMIYTLVTSAKEWLSELFAQDGDDENAGEDEVAKDEVYIIVFQSVAS